MSLTFRWKNFINKIFTLISRRSNRFSITKRKQKHQSAEEFIWSNLSFEFGSSGGGVNCFKAFRLLILLLFCSAFCKNLKRTIRFYRWLTTIFLLTVHEWLLQSLIQYSLYHRQKSVVMNCFLPKQNRLVFFSERKTVRYECTFSTNRVRRSWSAGGVIGRGRGRSGGGVFSLSIVFHIWTRFLALPCSTISTSRTFDASVESWSGDSCFVFHCSTNCLVWPFSK